MSVITENFQSESVMISGLCSTCNNTPSCSFRLIDPKRLIWYCELFDYYVQVKEQIPKSKAILDSIPESKNTRFKGLCMNCEICDTCTYPKPESGIWHCEEYC